MKRWTVVLAAVVALVLVADAIAAQPPGGGGRRPGAPGGRQPGGPGGMRQPGGPGGQGGDFRRPQMPVMVALDADKDGELSAEEIKNAGNALKKLDKNKDGKLDRDEMRPPRPEGRPGEGRPGGGQPSGRPGGGEGRPGGGPGGPGGAASFVERLMGLDKNGDKKISKDELPERMQRMIERADTNKDGALDKAELEKMAEGFGRGPGAGRGPGGGGDRPERPPRSE